MLRRFVPNLGAVLVAGLAGVLLLTGPARSADKETKQQFDNWAKSISAQNPAIVIDAGTNHSVTRVAKSSYQVAFPKPTGYRPLMVSPRWGGTNRPLDFSGLTPWEASFSDRRWKGVIVGRDPSPVGEGKAEPIGLPRFEYKLLPEVEGQPRRVNLKFWLAKDVKNEKPSWEFEVAAAVITPMTAAALDGRLGLFTLTAMDDEGDDVGAAIHPALDGHRLAYRPALLDLFAEESLFSEKDRMSEETLKKLMKQQDKNDKEKSFSLSAVVENAWKLDDAGLKAVDVNGDPGKSAFKFVHRLVYEGDEGKYKELPVSGQVNKEVFASLTDTEKQLVREYNEAVIVHRIIYWVKREMIVNFDRDQNWSKMIDELGDIYKSNLDKSIDAAVLAKASSKWASDYTGKDSSLPKEMRLK